MNEYLSITEMGRIYGVSSHVAGRWLKGLGLRTESGQPSTQAFNEKYVSQRPSRYPGTFYYVWHAGKTTAILDGMCYPRAVHDPVEREYRPGTS
jgi:hypothetical protein